MCAKRARVLFGWRGAAKWDDDGRATWSSLGRGVGYGVAFGRAETLLACLRLALLGVADTPRLARSLDSTQADRQMLLSAATRRSLHPKHSSTLMYLPSQVHAAEKTVCHPETFTCEISVLPLPPARNTTVCI
jgi:hypothetical protein